MLVILYASVVGLALVGGLLYVVQDRMIYLPRPYSAGELNQLPNGLIPLREPDDSLVGFYRPPAEGAVPKQLWMLFGGNADQALRWDDFAREHAAPGTGFLMVEYPGYGACHGSASPASILATNERAMVLLAEHLGVSIEDLHHRTACLGHSLGAATALQYAAKHPPRRLVLLSPFTSMKDMARRTVGWPFCELLVHRFDNRARLLELAAIGLPPTTIIHGQQDDLIPPAMGTELAAAHPAIQLAIISGAGHNDLFDRGEREIVKAMEP
jgi:uncharacterized protein